MAQKVFQTAELYEDNLLGLGHNVNATACIKLCIISPINPCSWYSLMCLTSNAGIEIESILAFRSCVTYMSSACHNILNQLTTFKEK